MKLIIDKYFIVSIFLVILLFYLYNNYSSYNNHHNKIKFKKEYILEKNFILKNTCDDIINFYENNINKLKMKNGGNSYFDDTLIFYKSINDSKIKSIVNTIRQEVLSKIKEFYNVKENLFIEQTNIVKWNKGRELGEHADNAYSNGKPNYTSWRTYSAVIFLNKDFSGGEFYFKNPYHEIIPEAGKLVGFGAGTKFMHGVKKVTDGARYTIAMWFTDNKDKIELD